MRLFLTISAVMLVFITPVLMGMQDADARRLGSGRSFGGKSIFSSPYQRATPSRQMRAPATPAQQRNTQMRQSFSQRGGLMGMLGGLALGGLLGALLFGGAFEHINFLDILLFGGLGYLGYKLLAARARSAMQGPSVASSSGVAAGPPDSTTYDHRSNASASGQRDFNTDLLFKNKPASVGSFDPNEFHASTPSQMPAGFDERAFLRGAEGAYRQLQKAWDQGDLTDIRKLTTEAVYQELATQLQECEGENRTDILQLNSELLGIKEVEGQWEAAVLFDTRLREIDETSESGQDPQWIKEVWHFTRPADSAKPTWYLDGIQQVEA